MKFWNFAETDGGRQLEINGVIAEESWYDDDVSPEEFKNELQKGTGDITVSINSPGGDCFAAAQIYNMLKAYPGKVSVFIDSLAASAASVIAMAGEEIEISPVGMLMIHNPSTMAFGDHKAMERAVSVLNEVKNSILNAYVEKTHRDRRELSDLMDKETWFSAQKALEYGFVDKIAGESNKGSFLFSNSALDRDVYARICAKYEQEGESEPTPESDTGTPDDTTPETGTNPVVTDTGGKSAAELMARLDAIGKIINV